MKKISLLLIGLAVLFSVPTQAQLGKLFKKKKPPVIERPKPKKEDTNGIKPYDKVITKKAITDKGLFDVHTVDDKFYYEIPDSLFGAEMLMVTRIAKTASGIGFGGGKQNRENIQQNIDWTKQHIDKYKTPGEILHEYIIKGLNISVPRLARALNVPTNRIYHILQMIRSYPNRH